MEKYKQKEKKGKELRFIIEIQLFFHITIQISLIGPSVSTSSMILAPNLKA